MCIFLFFGNDFQLMNGQLHHEVMYYDFKYHEVMTREVKCIVHLGKLPLNQSFMDVDSCGQETWPISFYSLAFHQDIYFYTKRSILNYPIPIEVIPIISYQECFGWGEE